MRARALGAALALAFAAAWGAGAARAADALRVQADGVASLPPFVPGAPPAKPPDAAALRALRQAAVANGVEAAVLAHASELAREDARGDEAALRAALGKLADYALGVGVLADLGAREARPKSRPGDPPPKPRKPTDPVPMEHAWRVEALVDGERVLAALRAAGLAMSSTADSGAMAEVVLEAPYDAASLAALRARIETLGARSALPRRFTAGEVVLSVRGLPSELLQQRLASQPPAGFSAEVRASETPGQIRVRLLATAPEAGGAPASKRPPSD